VKGTAMPETPTGRSFGSTDDLLEALLLTRREDVVRSRDSQADHLKDLEARGQERISLLRTILPPDLITVLDKIHDGASVAAICHVEQITTAMGVAITASENETAAHPGLAGGRLTGV
jgi:hypothetical protein